MRIPPFNIGYLKLFKQHVTRYNVVDVIRQVKLKLPFLFSFMLSSDFLTAMSESSGGSSII